MLETHRTSRVAVLQPFVERGLADDMLAVLTVHHDGLFHDFEGHRTEYPTGWLLGVEYLLGENGGHCGAFFLWSERILCLEHDCHRTEARRKFWDGRTLRLKARLEFPTQEPLCQQCWSWNMLGTVPLQVIAFAAEH